MVGLQAVTSWGGSGTIVGTRRCTASSSRSRAWGGVAPLPTRRGVESVPWRRKTSLKDSDTGVDIGVDVDADTELGEGEELLGTVDVSPKEIAEFFARPT